MAYKNLIVLPDGTELYSGMDKTNNVRSTSIKHMVNSGTELTLGSVCSALLEVKLQTPRGGLTIAEGAEVELYKVGDTRTKVGLFTLEKPTRTSGHTYKITAYDRVSWLDEDLTDWLLSLEGWPYAVKDFAGMVCEQCGLTLAETAWINGDYQIQQFTANGITGRQLMKWVGEIEARFVRATPDGEIELAWYKPNAKITIGPKQGTASAGGASVTDDGNGNVYIDSDDITVTDDGNGNVSINGDVIQVSDDGRGNVTITIGGTTQQVPYLQGGLSYEDYKVHPIERVRVRLTEDDMGVVYPVEGDGLNTYDITGNYLLTATESATLEPVAQNIFEAVKDVTYTPCTVKIHTTTEIQAGDIVQITDINGKTIDIYVMTKTQGGQSETLECTGSARRDSSTAQHDTSVAALKAKLLEIRKSIEGLNIKATSIEKDLEEITEIQVGSDGILTEVTEELDGVETRVSSLEQTVEGFEFEVRDAEGNSCTLVLKSGSVELAATTIKLLGTVTFEDLKNPGATVIAGENLSTGNIKAENVGITGRFRVFKVDADGNEVHGGWMGYLPGSADGVETHGIGVSNVASDVYVIITDRGARIQVGSNEIYGDKENAYWQINGDVRINGTLTHN